MRKAITILTIFLLTIILGFIEVINVNKVLDTMENIFIDLERDFELNQDNITQFYDSVGDAKEIWENNGEWLCHIFNHRDLSAITDSINRLKAFTKNNDYDNAICELSLLKDYYSDTNHVMGFSIKNIL